MTRPRKEQISLETTPYYHCISRCVRRAYLCGEDSLTKNSFEHRRSWLIQRLFNLTKIFTIDVATYALMSNHYHVVLRIDAPKAKSLTQEEIIRRWHQLFKGCYLSQKAMAKQALTAAEQQQLEKIIKVWRERLSSISWFMRLMNEYIARRANIEDNCTGRFWEGRFKSQALMGDKALLACMAYVDLNPVRAGMADTLDRCDYTGIQLRIALDKSAKEHKRLKILQPFLHEEAAQKKHTLPFTYEDYHALVEWSGHIVRDDKRGALGLKALSLLDDKGFSGDEWASIIQQFGALFQAMIGSSEDLGLFCARVGRKYRPNVKRCRRYFG